MKNQVKKQKPVFNGRCENKNCVYNVSRRCGDRRIDGQCKSFKDL